MTSTLDGQVALVTGSSRGIGRAIASELGRCGASVMMNGRDEGTLDEAVRDLGEQGIRAVGCVADVSDEVAVSAMFEQARTTFGPVDILVNNAGALAVVDAEEMTLSDWNLVLSTNLTGRSSARVRRRVRCCRADEASS